MAPEFPQVDNPYQSPPAEATIEAELVQGLTRRQRKTLEFYMKFRDQPPTVWGLLAMSATRWLGFAVICGMGAAFLFGVTILLDVSFTMVLFTTGLMIGMWLGTAARDAGIFRNFVAVWPALRDVLNWRRIEQRLGEDR